MSHADRIAKLKALLFDVDGIMTDNGLYVGEDGQALKKFCIIDGGGIKLAHLAGLKTGLISGHDSKATIVRAERLGMSICKVGVKDKVPVFESVLEQLGLSADETLYMGDDYMDVPLLKRVGFAATVPEAPAYVREVCHFVSTRAGGSGAVRDVIEHVLDQQGKLDEVMKRFL